MRFFQQRTSFASLQFVTLTLALFFSSISIAQAQSSSTVRVGFWTLWHDRTLTLSAAGDRATIQSCATCTPQKLSATLTVSADGDALVLKGSAVAAKHASTLALSGPITLAAHNESETPRLPITITAKKGVLVIAATMALEHYVERVVASESSAADSAESLKALAIVVRSFALHQKHGHAEYDLCDSTHCQLLHWHGNPGRASAAHAATLATSGETLWFHGTRAAVWFHQNCGGQTARPREIWAPKNSDDTTANLPYLTAHEDSYCTAKGARVWTATLTRAEIEAALSHAGLIAPGWKRMTIARRGDVAKNESPRVQTLRFDQKEISAENFRLAIGQSYGWGKILSTWFDFSADAGGYHFTGHGSGHGVGLCQAGAAAMAAHGQNDDAILKEYFPGADVRDEATGHAWQRQNSGALTIETLSADDAAQVPEVIAAWGEARTRAGGLANGAGPVTMRAFPTTTAFRDATLAPGWIAAFTEGNWIASQPLATLAARKLLRRTLMHEFLHAMVESAAAQSTPLWLREGFVEMLSREKTTAPSDLPSADEIDTMLRTATSERDSSRAHQAAADRAASLVKRYGRKQVEEWIRKGLPKGIN